MICGVRLTGGLGNLLFQIAFGESLSKKYGCDVVYTNLYEALDYNKRHYSNRTHAEEYLSVFPNIKWTKNRERLAEIKRVKRVPFHYVDIVPEDGVEYVGYFQSYKYWYSEDFVRWLFNYKGILAPDIYTYCCSIHVRRADYLKMPDFHTVLGMDYYHTAIDYLQRYDIKKYFIFSDDMEWCRENFKGDSFHFVHSLDYVDLWNMAVMRHSIIANSSLSLLAGLLNPNPNKVIISPLKDKWFGSKCKDSPQDIIPPYFIQL